MCRLALCLVALIQMTPVMAEEKKPTAAQIESCDYQAKMVSAIQQARLDRVKERDVPEHVLANSPEWPESYNDAIPLIAPWVYEQKRRVIRKEDLGAAWNELCLLQ